MSYTAWSVVYGEQPTAAKWNQLGSNDAGFKDGSNIDDDAIINRHMANDSVTGDNLSLDVVTNTLASTFTSAATSTWQDSGCKVTLPAIGTWLILANGRNSVGAASNFGALRLYNQTTSTAVTDGDRIAQLSAGSSMQVDTTLIEVVTTSTTNNIIRLEIKPGGTYAATLSSDTNGKTRMIAVRIG